MATGLDKQIAGWTSTLLTPFTQCTTYTTVQGPHGFKLLRLVHGVLLLCFASCIQALSAMPHSL